MKHPRKKMMKIWWKIPNIDDIPTSEARELIYRSMQIASDAVYHYSGAMHEPNDFRTFQFVIEADKGFKITNYMIGKIKDERVKYFAQIR